jgi:hypothetical protein
MRSCKLCVGGRGGGEEAQAGRPVACGASALEQRGCTRRRKKI